MGHKHKLVHFKQARKEAKNSCDQGPGRFGDSQGMQVMAQQIQQIDTRTLQLIDSIGLGADSVKS